MGEKNLKVELISSTPDGEKIVAAAAKLCYSKSGVADLLDFSNDEENSKFLSILTDLGHLSPVEHISMTFAVEGVSRSLTHQLVRHRLASYSQQSQRYVRAENIEYIIPPEIKKNNKLKEEYIKAMEASSKSYGILVEGLIENKMDLYLSEGMEEEKAYKKAEKEAIEDARYVFPNAIETKIVFTMNARSLMHFISLRTCNRAQWEIRELALKVQELALEKYPDLFYLSGPGCVKGPCPEGKMTCGKIAEVREFFTNRRKKYGK